MAYKASLAQGPLWPSWNHEDRCDGDGSYCKCLRQACELGELGKLHELFSTWLREQQPDLGTGLVAGKHFGCAARRAAESHQPACLTYLCQQGLKIDPAVIITAINGACRFASTTCLEVLLEYGWMINMPESPSLPPLMA